MSFVLFPLQTVKKTTNTSPKAKPTTQLTNQGARYIVTKFYNLTFVHYANVTRNQALATCGFLLIK